MSTVAMKRQTSRDRLGLKGPRAAQWLATQGMVLPAAPNTWAPADDGGRADEILAQVCNVNFAALSPDARPVIMTLMIGVAVLIVPQSADKGSKAERLYRIWCDPTFGPYLGESLGAVVNECGGRYTGVSE
jgi:sarcosine oxidase, subunit gamma